jgi:DNA-binding NarL/FixJ family response regulator
MLEALEAALADADDMEVVGRASSGTQVLPLVHQTSPDVVLLDLRMPGAGGLDCLRVLRENCRRVKVIIVSAVDDPAVVQRSLRGGASAFVSKQIDPRDLPSAIRQTVEETVVSHPGEWADDTGQGAAAEAGLTRSELAVLRALSQGLLNKQIAQELSVTQQTVKFHLTNVYRKLGVANRTEAARYAYEHGLAESAALTA